MGFVVKSHKHKEAVSPGDHPVIPRIRWIAGGFRRHPQYVPAWGIPGGWIPKISLDICRGSLRDPRGKVSLGIWGIPAVETPGPSCVAPGAPGDPMRIPGESLVQGKSLWDSRGIHGIHRDFLGRPG